ncbi:MAG: hypothetical protein H0T52_14410 [Lautropia sp.]|nr:hypothetical protein [Lautropia sp.]
MPAPTRSVIGIAWYRPEGYLRLAELMADGASFPKTYASWRQKALRMERELKRQGATPVRIEIEPEAFQRWCIGEAVATDSGARNRYVKEVLAGQPVLKD